MLLVALSLLVQLAAAIVAIRQSRRTGRAVAWLLIASAIALMAVRRIITLLEAVGPPHKPIDPTVEGIALLISLLLLLGLIGMGPLLGRWSTAAEDAAQLRHSVFNAAQAEIAVLDRSGTIIEVNQAWSEFTPAGALSPTPPFLRWNYLDVCRNAAATCPEAAEVGTGISDVLAARRPLFEMTYAMARPDGIRQFLVRVAPLGGGGGGAVVSHVDLTRVLGAEQRARELEARNDQIIDTMVDGIWMIDAEARTTFVNRQMAAMLGYTPEEMQGRHVFDFVDEAARASAAASLERRARGVQEQHDFRFQHRNGSSVWALVSTNPLRDDAGGYQGALAIVTNIDARKAADRALQESEHRYRSLVEITRTGYVIIDDQGRVLDANAEYLRLTGRGLLQEILGHPVTEWTAPHDAARNADEVRRGFETGKTVGLEVDYLWPDGTLVPIEINAAQVGDGSIMALCRDITSRRATMQALRESQDRYALAVAGSRSGIWDWNVVTGETLLSPEWKALLGYADAELANHLSSWEQLLHPDDRARTMEALRQHFEARTPYVLEYRMRARDGSWRWFLVHGQARWDAAGTPVRMAGSTIDITAEKQARQALQTLEARFRQLAEGISEVFWLVELAPRVVLYVSPSFERLWGISTAALQESPVRWQAAVHPEDRAAVLQAWAALAEPAGPEGYDIEYRILRPDGELRWIHDRATLIRATGAAPTMVSGVASDITDRRRSEAAEREMHQQISALIAASPLPIVGLAASGEVTGWNPAAERSFGWRSDEVLGRYLPIVPPDLDEEYRRFRSEVLAGAALSGRLARRQHRDGTMLDVMISTAPTRDATGRITGLVAIYEDVTGRMQLEERQRQLQLRLTESQKLESLGVLAGGIAHDFNNLLTIIQGNAQLARGEVSPTAPVQASLEQIETAAGRAAELTAQMLTYAGKGQFQVVPLSLTELVAAQQQLLVGLLPGGTTLRLSPATGQAMVNGDPSQLRQLLVNLVTNAAEAMPPMGGAIGVSVGEQLLDEATLERSLYPEQLRPGRCTVLQVTDTGSGMDPEMVSRMFEPFVSSRFAGRGLGLAAVAGIVRRHHGTATVESVPGRGTAVRIYLPLPIRARESGGRTTRSAGTVLMVDDEKEVLRLMGRFLERGGFEVLLAPGGAEALALHAERQGNIDVVILDLTMPGMSGEATLAALRQLDPDLPAIFTSGYTKSEVLRRCGGLRISGFLLKPYLPSELTELVREVLKGGRPHPADSRVPGSR